MSRYILNHYYLLRHDSKRSYIMSSRNASSKSPIVVNTGWTSRIHPAYAMMLSFFSNPINLNEASRNISNFFSIPEEKIKIFLHNLIESKETTYTHLENSNSGFPVNIIIEESAEFTPRRLYKPEDFSFEKLDFNTSRMLKAPVSIVFMPNNNCFTDCIYCYADTKTRRQSLGFDKIEDFINEAKDLNIRDILITGGDFFMYNQWERLLLLLKKQNYEPDLISTKVPLNQDQILSFSKFGISLQISLDSLLPNTVGKILSVSEKYTKKIEETILNVDKSNIRYQIATVLTNLNDSILELEKLSLFISTLKHIERWEIRIAFKSLYSKSNFDDIKTKREKIKIIEDWIRSHKDNFPIEILWSPDDDWMYKKTKGGSRYFEGAKCSANMTNMVILPDGEVTICEQLYWNENFIIGNINKNSITEIWNSKEAVDLWKKDQKNIQEESQCKKCVDFDDCFNASNRCYANIMKAYGRKNFEFPDPRCHLAPNFINQITHE